MADHLASGPFARQQLIRWAPAIAWMTVIFALSAQPSLTVAEDPLLDFVLRKAGHVAVFALLAMLLVRPFTEAYRPDGVRSAVVVAVLFAISDELHQGTVAGRAPTLLDVGIDAVGAVLGGVTIRWLVARRDADGVTAKRP